MRHNYVNPSEQPCPKVLRWVFASREQPTFLKTAENVDMSSLVNHNEHLCVVLTDTYD